MILRKCLLAVFFCTAVTYAQNNCTTQNPNSGITPIEIVVTQHDGNGPCNLMDNDYSTRWSAQNNSTHANQKATFDFGTVTTFDQAQIAFYRADQRASIFDLEVSTDGTNWTKVRTNVSSTQGETGLQTFSFPSQNARYLRYFGKGNSGTPGVANWNSLLEFRILNSNGGNNSCTDGLSTEYEINGTWLSGNSSITVNAGDTVTLSGLPNSLVVTVTDPSGTVHGDDYDLGSMTASKAGRYYITSSNCSLPLDIVLSGSTDTTPPSTPTLSSSSVTNNSAALSWSAASDNTGVTGYSIFRDGANQINTGNVTNYQITGLAANTQYTFMIRAFDAAGNVSGNSNTVTITTDEAGGSGSSQWANDGNGINYGSNVGIGTAAQSGYELAVDGKIHTKEVRVDDIGWADYVFYNDYRLPTLQEVEQHIQEKGHLINIPSAAEVEANGIELGEMNKLLLEKIEELTLYILQQEKRIELLEYKE